MVRNAEFTDHIRDVQSKREKSLFIGQVATVHDKETNELQQGNIEVNVADPSGDHELRRIPFVSDDHTGHVSVPQVGESVVVDYVKGKGRAPVAVGLTSDDRDGFRSPHAKEGHWRHEWTARPDTSGDNLYLEAEPADHSGGAPELVRMGIKPDGLSDPTTEVTVDNSGENPEIRLKTDGTVTVDCDTINLGKDGLASVLNENATIKYQDGDSFLGGAGGNKTATIQDTGTSNTNAG